MHVKKGKKIQK